MTQLVEAVLYKPGLRGFDSRRVTGIFHGFNTCGRTKALGLTQPIADIATRGIFRWIKAAGL